MGRPRVTHCKRGHEFTPDNTVKNSKGRSCRICRNANAKIRYNASEELRRRMSAGGAAYRERMKQGKIGAVTARERMKQAKDADLMVKIREIPVFNELFDQLLRAKLKR